MLSGCHVGMSVCVSNTKMFIILCSIIHYTSTLMDWYVTIYHNIEEIGVVVMNTTSKIAGIVSCVHTKIDRSLLIVITKLNCILCYAGGIICALVVKQKTLWSTTKKLIKRTQRTQNSVLQTFV